MSGTASPVTEAAESFVAAHVAAAEALGRDLADDISDVEAFVARLRAGLGTLSDQDYLEGAQLVAPGIGPLLGVRWPLLQRVERSFARRLGHVSTSELLWLADRLDREEIRELRWFAMPLLTRSLAGEPERTWQLIRRAARKADDWISVDTLAHCVGSGILLEPYRWAEVEQLVYSPSRWERRLVGSTIATMPFVDRVAGRTPEVVRRGLGLVRELIGDDEPDVQKALSWALRTLAALDRPAVERFCREEARAAANSADGNRAWVLRDACSKLDPGVAAAIREQLARIRRRGDSGPTSRASAAAALLADLPRASDLPEPPLT